MHTLRTAGAEAVSDAAIPMKHVRASDAHVAFRKALEEAIRTQGANLDAQEILAILAHLVGQVLAVQDQRKITPGAGMEIVAWNIETGNAEAIAALIGTPGGHA